MRAAVLHGLGEVPRCAPFPDPVAGDGEVVVEVRAAALKPVDKQIASGTHYASPKEFPCVCGTDGVGLLSDGQRVFFGGARAPYGAMAERSVVRKPFAFPLPDGVDDATAAALPNPGVSAWLSLAFRAKLAAGDKVLILGATGVTGTLAVRIAKILGAGRVIAAGRNPDALRMLEESGADATISLAMPEAELREAFAREAAGGLQVVIDYVWGRPAELLLGALANHEFAAIQTETRYVQVGEGAGPTIALPAAVLRSAAVSILGTAGIPPREMLAEALRRVFEHAARGELRVATEPVPLAEVERAWGREVKGRRVVLVP